MKVAFIIPGKVEGKWLVREETRTRKEHFAYPPYQAAVFLSIIKKALPDAEVKVFDCQIEDWDSLCLKQKISIFKPDLAVCQLSAFYLTHDIQFCGFPGVFTIASISPSSIDVSEADALYSLPVDAYLKNEKEWTLFNALREFYSNNCIMNTPGLLIKDRQTGSLKDTGEAGINNGLDDLPFPDFRGINYGTYVDLREKALGIRYGIIETSHGCLFNCRYCSQARHSKKAVFKSAKVVNREIKYLKKNFNIEFLEFQDSEFGFNKQRSRDICRYMIEGDYQLKWVVNNRVELADEETLLLMKRAGCKEISYGIESADENVLKQLGKNVNLKKAIQVIDKTKKIGIKVNLFFMIGVPGETKESLIKSILFIKQTRPQIFGFAPYIPMPNTPIYHDLKLAGNLLDNDWNHYVEPFKDINAPMAYYHECYPTRKELLKTLEWVRRRAFFQLAFCDISRSISQRLLLLIGSVIYRERFRKAIPNLVYKSLLKFRKVA
jgi:uncharacterized radical SAM superfamily protein